MCVRARVLSVCVYTCSYSARKLSNLQIDFDWIQLQTPTNDSIVRYLFILSLASPFILSSDLLHAGKLLQKKRDVSCISSYHFRFIAEPANTVFKFEFVEFHNQRDLFPILAFIPLSPINNNKWWLKWIASLVLTQTIITKISRNLLQALNATASFDILDFMMIFDTEHCT